MKRLLIAVVLLLAMVSTSFADMNEGCASIANTAYDFMLIRQAEAPIVEVLTDANSVPLTEAQRGVVNRIIMDAYRLPLQEELKDKVLISEKYRDLWYDYCLEVVGKEI